MPVRPTTARARLLTAALAAAASVALTPAVAAGPANAATADCVSPPIAHRGASAAAPENTIPAYRAALRSGITRLDLDVRFTRTGIPVVMHDSTVDRTTDGTGPVSRMTLAELRSLDAGSWFSPEFAGVRVPTLRQALDFGRTRGATYQLELKGRPTAQQVDDFLNRVRWLGMLSRVRVISFDEQTIGQVRAKEPAVATGIIDFSGEPRPADAVLAYGSTYVIGVGSVTQTRAERWRAAGIEVRPWTVNTVKGWARMAYDDAGPVITDRPVRYLSWARGFCS